MLAGIESLAACLPIKADDIEGLKQFVIKEQVDLTVVGPEAPLAAPKTPLTPEALRLEVTESVLMENAEARGHEAVDGLRAALAGSPIVSDVRGIGLMIAVDFVDGETAAAVEVAAFERGLLVLTCGDRGVRMSPPLVVTAAEVQTAVRIFADAVAAIAATR